MSQGLSHEGASTRNLRPNVFQQPLVKKGRSTNLGVGNLDVTPTPIDHMALRQDPHLSLVGREPDEPEALGLAGLDVFLNLKNKI